MQTFDYQLYRTWYELKLHRVNLNKIADRFKTTKNTVALGITRFVVKYPALAAQLKKQIYVPYPRKSQYTPGKDLA